MTIKTENFGVRRLAVGGWLVALRYGGSTSSSTAGVLACQWNKAPPFTLCRSHPPFWIPDKIRQRKFYHKEHKEIIDGRFAAEASKYLENMECPTAPLVSGRLRPLYSEGG